MNAVVEFCKGTLTLVFKLEQMKAELIAGDEGIFSSSLHPSQISMCSVFVLAYVISCC